MTQERWETKENEKVCYFDIDGVLNDYPDCWLRFLRKIYEESPGTLGIEAEDLCDLNRAKNSIPYQLYKDLKTEYRESGYKTTIPINGCAKKVLESLKHDGFHIVIITSRPVKAYPCLFKQTTDWLSLNGIPFDDIIFDDDKYLRVAERYPHLRFGVDDHRYYANLVAKWGYPMFLLNNQYNEGPTVSGVTRIDSLSEILDHLNL